MKEEVKIIKKEDASIIYETEKKHTFFFHFNKPSTQRTGKVQVSFHFWNEPCFIVDNIYCETSCHGKMSKTQPRWVMRGKTNKFVIKDNVVTIF